MPVFGQSQFPNYVCKTLRVILSTCIFAQIPGCYLWAQLSTAIYIFRTLTKHTHLCYLPPTKSDGTPTTSDVTPTKSKQMEIHFTSIGIKVWYNWQHFGIKLGSVCDQSGVIWGSFFDHARIILGALGPLAFPWAFSGPSSASLEHPRLHFYAKDRLETIFVNFWTNLEHCCFIWASQARPAFLFVWLNLCLKLFQVFSFQKALTR